MNFVKVIHPYLFAISPLIFFYLHNSHQVSLTETIRPLSVVLLVALLLVWMLSRITGSHPKAGACLSLLSVVFFSYSYLLLLVQSEHYRVGWRWFVTLACVLGSLFGQYKLLSTRSNLDRLTNFLNLTGLFVLFTNIAVGAPVVLEWMKSPAESLVPAVKLTAPKRPPNIYYIILDEYARADVLRELFDYDNQAFLQFLQQKGFYVASQSHSNYSQTYLSLASSLNFSYLQDIATREGTNSTRRAPLRQMVQRNNAARCLQQAGYRLVAFSTSDSLTDIKSADVHLSPRWHLSEFENALLMTTPIGMSRNLQRFQMDLRRNQILYILDTLAETTELEGPLFVFAHIMSPHPPFLFDENGESTENLATTGLEAGFRADRYATGYVASYRKQAIFVTRRIQQTIDEIFRRSAQPPIIILQSDHGTGSRTHWNSVAKTDMKERMSILNAYYLPGQSVSKFLYPRITPVNTFRVVFNQYFHANLDLLNDESYFSTWDRPYEFFNVSAKLTD